MRIDEALIHRYLVGECNLEEKQAVEAWLEDNDSVDVQLSGINKEVLTEDMEWIKNKLPERIIKGVDKIPSNTRSRSIIYSIAASLLIMLCLSLYVITTVRRSSDKASIHWKEMHNTGEGMQRFSLSDGSDITLYPGAVVLVPDSTVNMQRRLKIVRGKALFNIRHSASSTFRVETGRSEIEVLGTTFIVDRNHAGDIVTLQSGRISFSVPGKPLQVLVPGQQVSYDSATGNIRITQVASRQEQQPVNMNFSNVPLHTVFSHMETKFDIRIVLKDPSIGNLRYTGNLTGKSLEDMKTILTLSADIRFREDNNILYVSQ